MKVGIIQSSFLPWRGYFDFIREVDLFILLDDVQFARRTWRSRNRIKTARGARWITVPVKHPVRGQAIDSTTIADELPWAAAMVNRLRAAYRGAPFLDPYLSELAGLLATPAPSLSELNRRLLGWGCHHLGITTPIAPSRQYCATGVKTARLISILRQVDATTYLSGPSAASYLEPEQFARAGIRLEYKAYDYPEYEQLHPPFDPQVSVVDLLFMKGAQASEFLETPT